MDRDRHYEISGDAKNDSSKDFSNVNETGPSHEVKDAVSYMTMMIMIMVMGW